MSLTAQILRFAAPLPRPEQAGRLLFIGPHPDDILIGAGATAARFAAEGKELCFLNCTDGRYGIEQGDTGLPFEELAVLREQEELTAARALGVRDVRFLRLSDGGFYRDEELLQGIARTVADFQPDFIFAPDPEVSSECHPDHRRVGRAAATAAVFAYNRGIMERLGCRGTAKPLGIAFYMTAHPSRFVNTSGYLKKQLAILTRCYPSQFPKDSEAARSLCTYLKLRAAEYGLRSLSVSAEGFRVLGPTQLHCLPEAGK